MADSPLPIEHLKETVIQVCESTFASLKGYNHSQTLAQNTAVINEVLQNLVSETSKDHKPSPYKFHVSSTIIQHTPSAHSSPGPTESRSEEAASSGLANGRRGMHSAAGAFWDDKKDGMWSYKYEGNTQQGFDVVVSVIWVSRS